jgi:tetratricopeptide (TPR) repeat protein
VKRGDLLLAAAGSPVETTSDYLAVLRGAKPGEEATYSLEGKGGPREVSVKHLSTPVLLPRKDEAILYNKAIADLMQEAAVATDPGRKAYAWLNVAVALMELDQHEAAIHEALRRADLPDRAGISKGTVRFLAGVCYEKLGRANEARAAYEEAASSAAATLDSHDGPTLAASAKRRASHLGT